MKCLQMKEHLGKFVENLIIFIHPGWVGEGGGEGTLWILGTGVLHGYSNPAPIADPKYIISIPFLGPEPKNCII